MPSAVSWARSIAAGSSSPTSPTTSRPSNGQSRVYAQARRQKVDNVLEPALATLAGRSGVEPASIDSSSPARGLHELAYEYCKYGTGILAIGSTHRGPVGRVVVGSVGELLVSGCPCPIMVAPHGFAQHAPESIAKIVAGFDGSAESHAALHVAHALARAADAQLHVIAVVHRSALARPDHGETPARNREALQARLDEALTDLGGSRPEKSSKATPPSSSPRRPTAADMLVVGARGYGPRNHVLRGQRLVQADAERAEPGPDPPASACAGRLEASHIARA